MISNIARSAIYFVVIAGTTLVSAAVLSRQGESSGEVKHVLAERGLVPMGVDATYTNYDAWIPPGCAAHGWTGFQFAHPANSACFGVLYDGPANPFARPPNPSIPGVPGTRTASGSGTLIEWNNVAAPVTAGPGTSRDGHFGYQFNATNPGCPPGSSGAPSAAWRRSSGETLELCHANITTIELTTASPLDSTFSSDSKTQTVRARVIVRNESTETISITLAAIPWPEGPPRDTDAALLNRLVATDSLFATHFASVTPVAKNVTPSESLEYDFDVPDDETVVLARYSVMNIEEELEYIAYIAFEGRVSLFPLSPTPTDTPDPTSTATATPPTPSPSPTGITTPWRVVLPMCFGPVLATP